jgi:hypothetical protein
MYGIILACLVSLLSVRSLAGTGDTCRINKDVLSIVLKKCQKDFLIFGTDTLLVGIKGPNVDSAIYDHTFKIKWPKYALITSDINHSYFIIDNIKCDAVYCINCIGHGPWIKMEFHSNPNINISKIRNYSGYIILNYQTLEVVDFSSVSPEN